MAEGSGLDGERDPVEDSRMTLGEHLSELRTRLIRASAVLVVAFVVLYTFRLQVIEFIDGPYVRAAEQLNVELAEIRREQVAEDPDKTWRDYFQTEEMERLIRGEAIDPKPTSFKAGGPFLVKIKACFWLSLFIAGPVFLWEIWMFVAAGLYKAERKVVYTYFPTSLTLFLTGVVFGFVVLVPAAIYFLQRDGLGLDDIPRTMELDQYMQFLKSLSLALGVVFQLPVFQVALSKMGAVAPRTYAKFRGHMAIVALIVAAIITPPDPVTQIMLAGPAIVLWEVGIWLSRLVWTEPVASEVDELEAGQGASA
ncbi:MAG: twin-arginine translocase subunit TatC [Planctomycetota bacterium]